VHDANDFARFDSRCLEYAPRAFDDGSFGFFPLPAS